MTFASEDHLNDSLALALGLSRTHPNLYASEAAAKEAIARLAMTGSVSALALKLGLSIVIGSLVGRMAVAGEPLDRVTLDTVWGRAVDLLNAVAESSLTWETSDLLRQHMGAVSGVLRPSSGGHVSLIDVIDFIERLQGSGLWSGGDIQPLSERAASHSLN